MTTAAMIVMAVALFAVRLSGFVLSGIGLPPPIERSLRFTPIAVLAAVTVAIISGAGRPDTIGFTALSAGSIAAWLTRKVWICLAVGMLAAVVGSAIM